MSSSIMQHRANIVIQKIMMRRKITAWVIILLVIIFPFRKAFLSGETPGIMMMLAFVVTLAGIGIFYYLMSTSENNSDN